ncbi:hypothetical protein [Streptomyces xanthochromogenes]|uniref:hypothetical protein n=1 Tax=Streptomyces xanthochromogenes TaxID=67384 RepID=UPI003F4DF5FF
MRRYLYAVSVPAAPQLSVGTSWIHTWTVSAWIPYASTKASVTRSTGSRLSSTSRGPY